MIGSLNIGGSQAMILNLYDAIDRTKIQFDFVIDEPFHRAMEDRVLRLGGRIYVMPKFNGFNFRQVRKAWDKFLTEHGEYSILHSHVRSYASIFIPIAKKHGLKTIIHSHSTTNGHGLSALLKKTLQYPLRYQADYLFACSPISGKWLFGKNVINKRNFYVIPNCIDVSRYLFSEENRDRVRSEYGIKENELVIGHVGRFNKVKNHNYLISVFSEVLKKNINAKLLLVGEGELKNQVSELCHELNVEDKVIFTGGQRDTAPFYSAMDVFVFPSLWEGVPLTVVEAQSAGLPCLISDTITKDVHLTDLVETMSIQLIPEKWSEKIECKMEESKRTLGDKQRKKLEKYDSCKVAEALDKFYLEC